MSDSDLIGEIRLFPYNYVPRGWLPCNGQSLDPSHNSALFAVIGAAWGGDGSTSFNLPNLNARAAIGAYAGQRLGTYDGHEQVTVTGDQLPPHNHTLQRKSAVTIATKVSTPSLTTDYGQVHVFPPSGPPVVTSNLSQNGTPNTTFSRNALESNGLGEGHENRQPYLALIYAICLDGMFPQFD